MFKKFNKFYRSKKISFILYRKFQAFLDKDAVDFLDNISATALEKIGSHTQLNATVSVKWKYNNETDGNIAKADYVIVDNKQKVSWSS